MINIISAIGSIGTFIMALFYFISVTVQLYQMKMSFCLHSDLTKF